MGEGEGDGVGMDADFWDISTMDFSIMCEVASGSSPPVLSFSRYFFDPSPSTESTGESPRVTKEVNLTHLFHQLQCLQYRLCFCLLGLMFFVVLGYCGIYIILSGWLGYFLLPTCIAVRNAVR